MKTENPKPIFIVLIPDSADYQVLTSIEKSISERMRDYHVLVVPNNKDEFDFKGFYYKDLVPVDFEELKTICREGFVEKPEFYSELKP